LAALSKTMAAAVSAPRRAETYGYGMPTRTTSTFSRVVDRLNDASVARRCDAYRDIDWNGPDTRIDARDPRFRLSSDSALGGTEWYQSLPLPTQAKLGLDWLCQVLAYGVAFESCLCRGLLELAETLPVSAPELRYALHEVVEESHHSMMFIEFVKRSGQRPARLPLAHRVYDRHVARSGATFPESFFFHVLAGEVFIDFDNRGRLRRKADLHPLVRRMLEVHVMEESRHVAFAEHYLREHVPKLSWWRALRIRAALPVVLAQGERLMLHPPRGIVRRYAIPRGVLAHAFGRRSGHRERVRAIEAPILALAPRSLLNGTAVATSPEGRAARERGTIHGLSGRGTNW
jgi:hypothetical protein